MFLKLLQTRKVTPFDDKDNRAASVFSVNGFEHVCFLFCLLVRLLFFVFVIISFVISYYAHSENRHVLATVYYHWYFVNSLFPMKTEFK